MATTFTPLNTQVNWTDATVGVGNTPLPPNESLKNTILAVRPDGNTNFGPGNYQQQIVVPAPAASMSKAAFLAAFATPLTQGGNYWLSAAQTDTLNGTDEVSGWSPEVPFQVPFQPVVPASPLQLSVS